MRSQGSEAQSSIWRCRSGKKCSGCVVVVVEEAGRRKLWPRDERQWTKAVVAATRPLRCPPHLSHMSSQGTSRAASNYLLGYEPRILGIYHYWPGRSFHNDCVPQSFSSWPSHHAKTPADLFIFLAPFLTPTQGACSIARRSAPPHYLRKNFARKPACSWRIQLIGAKSHNSQVYRRELRGRLSGFPV